MRKLLNINIPYYYNQKTNMFERCKNGDLKKKLTNLKKVT